MGVLDGMEDDARLLFVPERRSGIGTGRGRKGSTGEGRQGRWPGSVQIASRKWGEKDDSAWGGGERKKERN